MPERSFRIARRLQRLAWLLDNSIPLPFAGGRYRIGLDALIGLVPGIGDVIGTVVSAYIIAQSARIGAPRAILVRMAVNVAVEALVGMVPLAGDLFDAGWKANQRNVALLRAWLKHPAGTQRASAAFLVQLVLLLLALLAGVTALAWLLVRWLLSMF
jgi:hypothetical protein